MPTNSINRPRRTPPAERKGIKISQRTRDLYEKRDRSLDDDPDVAPLPPDRWANAMRRARSTSVRSRNKLPYASTPMFSTGSSRKVQDISGVSMKSCGNGCSPK